MVAFEERNQLDEACEKSNEKKYPNPTLLSLPARDTQEFSFYEFSIRGQAPLMWFTGEKFSGHSAVEGGSGDI